MNAIIMGDTNNLYNKTGARLMGAVETSDEIFYLVQKLESEGFKVGIMKFIGRQGKARPSDD